MHPYSRARRWSRATDDGMANGNILATWILSRSDFRFNLCNRAKTSRVVLRITPSLVSLVPVERKVCPACLLACMRRSEYWIGSRRCRMMALCVIYCGQTRRRLTAGGSAQGERAICSAVTSLTSSTRRTTCSSSREHTRCVAPLNCGCPPSLAVALRWVLLRGDGCSGGSCRACTALTMSNSDFLLPFMLSCS